MDFSLIDVSRGSFLRFLKDPWAAVMQDTTISIRIKKTNAIIQIMNEISFFSSTDIISDKITKHPTKFGVTQSFRQSDPK